MKYCLVSIIVATLTVGCLAQESSRQDPREGRLQGTKQRGNETCGTLDDLAQKVEDCAKPAMDIIEGKLEKWPRNEKDVVDLCAQIAGSEKCIREQSRKCAKGLQKTVLSTVANSIARSRKRECTKQRLPALLKTTQCIERNQVLVRNVIANITSRLEVVEKQMQDLDQKTTGVCCMVHEIEANIRASLGPICPDEAIVFIRMYRTVVEDVVELICRNPKCKDAFKGFTAYPTKYRTGIIAVLLRILFSLG